MKEIFLFLHQRILISIVMTLLFIGTTEIVVIGIVALLLFFGGRKIPELMRGLGKGVKSFKDGVEGKDDPDLDKGTDIKEDKEK